jgi:homoserine O-acetyltransferase
VLNVVKLLAVLLLLATASLAQNNPQEHDFVTSDFKFRSGETLPELKIHYMTYGRPQTDSRGRTTNAVLILHGTTGSGDRGVLVRLDDLLQPPSQVILIARNLVKNIGHTGHAPTCVV